jgi:hypothetical protein
MLGPRMSARLSFAKRCSFSEKPFQSLGTVRRIFVTSSEIEIRITYSYNSGRRTQK